MSTEPRKIGTGSGERAGVIRKRHSITQSHTGALAVGLGLNLLSPLIAHASPKLVIDSTPSGAKVFIDDKGKGIQCQSGSDCKPKVAKGAHRFMLELDGYLPFEQTIEVTGKKQQFTFALKVAPARVEVKTLATNAAAQGGEIFVDGTLAGTVPTTIELTAGKHTIEVKRSGFIPYSDTIEVKSGEARPLLIGMNPEPKAVATMGSISISAEAEGSEVSVDDQPRGPAPVRVENLSPGDHVVEVRPKDKAREAWRKNIRVTAGQQALAQATFAAVVVPGAAPPPPPAKPEIPLYPVAFVPKIEKNTYVVTTSSGATCTTPCSLKLPAGNMALNVSGPGSFQKFVIIPKGPAEARIQHRTLSRLVGGSISLGLGIAQFVIGSLYQFDQTRLPESIQLGNGYDKYIGPSLMSSGSTMILAGVTSLALVKLNSIEFKAMAPPPAPVTPPAPPSTP